MKISKNNQSRRELKNKRKCNNKNKDQIKKKITCEGHTPAYRVNGSAPL
jgi:hypothetical protein